MTTTRTSPRLDAVLFDMDGVVTDTAEAHAAAWKRLFDDYLSERASREGHALVPFDAEQDYRRFVDGMPRYDGVRSFLASRGIALPEGKPGDPPDRETVCGLGNRKDGFFREWLEQHRVRTFPGTMALIDGLQRSGVRTGIFSASRNASDVLRRAGVLDRFEARFDGTDLAQLGLLGKPDPAMLLALAERLGIAPERAAIIEDAVAGVQAGARGGFGFVVGVDRGGNGEALASNGADLVVGDAGELDLDAARLAPRTIDGLPSLGEHWSEIEARVCAAKPAVFLDYDGTLTDIVEDPDKAFLSEETRCVLSTLAQGTPVAVVSGRDLAKLREFVALDSIYYAASHGFEIAGPNGYHQVAEGADTYVDALDDAQNALGPALEGIRGHFVERKAFAMAVHYRRVAESDIAAVEQAVDDTLVAFPRLRKTGGKKVFEIVPDMRWHKGEAVSTLLEHMGLDWNEAFPIYVGDDLTDEDAFRMISGRGLGIVVREGTRRTSADYAVDGPAEVRALLARFAALGCGNSS